MLYADVKAKLDLIPNGRIFKADFTTSLEKKVSASARENGYEVYKHTSMPCRKGIEYSNTNYIKQIQSELGYQIGKRANGTKDTANKGFADSTLGNKLVDLFATTCLVERVQKDKPIDTPKVEYIVRYNGTDTKVNKADLKAMGIMINSFFNEADNEAKVAEMLTMKSAWESDKANYPQANKDKLARLIRDCYNKMFSVKVENINSIG